jgi:parallel beta-helix repeat protein
MSHSRCLVLTVLIVCISSSVFLFSNTFAQPKAAGRLPGAQPAIDAAKFPSIQAAVDALPATGGIVQLPAGVFEIDKTIVINKPDVTFQGVGSATHIKNVNTEGKPALLLVHPDGGQSRKQELWRIRLANFRITGNEKSGHGIEARHINEIFIQGVTVSYHGGDGIRLDHCYEDARVSDSLITYNKATGLNLLGCHDIVVASNQFEENHDALRCFDGFNLCMTGNCLDDHLGNGVVIENTYGSVVSGNMIEECKGAAVILDRDCYGDTISANVIAHNGQGIVLKDAHGCAISANTFTILKTDAIRIEAKSDRITVTGNNFSNSYIGEGKVKRGAKDLAAAGMTIENASDIVVSGNLFSSVKPVAMKVTGDKNHRILFSNNVLTDVPSNLTTLKNSLVTDNLEAK